MLPAPVPVRGARPQGESENVMAYGRAANFRAEGLPCPRRTRRFSAGRPGERPGRS